MLHYIIGEGSPGSWIIDKIMDQHEKGRMKWFPIGEVSGYVWMLVFNLLIWSVSISLAVSFFVSLSM